MTMLVQSYIATPEQGSVWEMEPGRPTTFRLLSEQTGGSVAVFDEVVPAGGGTPFHIHPTSDEVIYVLEGEFTFKIGEQIAKGSDGTYVFIPRGTPHGWRNTGNEAGKATFTFTPADGAKFFEALSQLQLPAVSIDRATLEAYGKRYGYELIAFDWQ
jgi:quercetin dioxygenase-like cupin family protein